MRWPWRHREARTMPDDDRAAAEQAMEALRQLDERQSAVDELERWGRRESRLNGFSERMRRGMGGNA